MRELKVALSMGANGITAGGVVVSRRTQTHPCRDGAVRDACGGNMTSLIL